MKAMGNLKWKLALCVIGLAMMLGVTFVASGTPAVSAVGTCTVTVQMPAELAAVGAKVSIYPWNSSYGNGEWFIKNVGETITWRLIKVNGFDGPMTYNLIAAGDTMDLVVGTDTYCKMQVKNVPDGGKINYYPWNKSWTNNQEVILPMGASITWLLNLNGFDGQQYRKVVDCTPLDAKQAWIYVGNSSCNMKVQLAADLVTAGAKVNVYPWNTNWVNDQVIAVPIGGSCTWRLVVNGFTGNTTYTKKFDCTPLVVNGSHYCMMQVKNVPDGIKVNVYPWNTYWDNTTLIAVPISGSCTWKLTGPGAPATQHVKNFDCTALDASTP